jgi:hypothetical protein
MGIVVPLESFDQTSDDQSEVKNTVNNKTKELALEKTGELAGTASGLRALSSLEADEMDVTTPEIGTLPILTSEEVNEMSSELNRTEFDETFSSILAPMETSEMEREILGIGVLSPLDSMEAEKFTELAPGIGVLSFEKPDKMFGKQERTKLDLPEVNSAVDDVVWSLGC